MSEISEGECSVDGKSNCPLLMAVPEIFLCMLDLQLLRPIRSTDCDMSQRKTDILPWQVLVVKVLVLAILSQISIGIGIGNTF